MNSSRISINRSSVSAYKLNAKTFDFARHENPDSWSDLLTLLKRISDFQILLYSVQYSFWQAAEGSASSSRNFLM
jgi:hypothetical protein